MRYSRSFESCKLRGGATKTKADSSSPRAPLAHGTLRNDTRCVGEARHGLIRARAKLGLPESADAPCATAYVTAEEWTRSRKNAGETPVLLRGATARPLSRDATGRRQDQLTDTKGLCAVEEERILRTMRPPRMGGSTLAKG